MRRSRVRLNLLFFGILFVVLLVEATRSVITVGQITHPYRLAADFSNANGVLAHDEVDYLGVPIGEVSGVDRIPGGVKVRMAITRGRNVPTGSIANLDLKSAIGEQYINFEPPAGYQGNHGPYYQAGFTVPMADTTTPVQFADLLRSANSLLASIPPDALASLLHELAVGLNDSSDSLRTLVQSGDRLSGALVTRTRALDQLLTDSTRLVHVVTDHRDALTQQLSDLRQLAATLQSIQPTTNRLLDTASPLFQTVAGLLAAQQGHLDCTLKGINPILDLLTTPRKQKELTTLLDVGPRAFGGVFDSRDVDSGPSGTGYSGVWLRVGLVVNGTSPSVMYTPPRAQPQPVAVAGCTSALRPVGADYRPANVSARFSLLDRRMPPAGGVVVGAALALMGLAYRGRRHLRRTVVVR